MRGGGALLYPCAHAMVIRSSRFVKVFVNISILLFICFCYIVKLRGLFINCKIISIISVLLMVSCNSILLSVIFVSVS